MKNIKYIIGLVLFVAAIVTGCKEETYEFGALTAPTNLVINTEIVGKSTDKPDGDGSGVVNITVNAQNAITYHIGFNKIDNLGPVTYSVLASGTKTHKFTDPGTNTYRISVIAYGPGGTATNLSKDITVRSDYVPDPLVVTALTNDASKTWVVNKDVRGHLGVGPYGDATPWWWEAAVDEKLGCCPCFYTAKFTFTKNANGSYSLTVNAPDGAFTKTGNLTNLPGIPATGDEGCYSQYTGGTSGFNFIPYESGLAYPTPSKKVAISLATNDVYIGYGAVQSVYEILDITDTSMYLRVQGTETGNAWYLKLKPAP